MDDTDDFIEVEENSATADDKVTLLRAFGDDVAQRFLRLRGIDGERMQNELLERYAQRQATRVQFSANNACAASLRVHASPVVLASFAK